MRSRVFQTPFSGGWEHEQNYEQDLYNNSGRRPDDTRYKIQRYTWILWIQEVIIIAYKRSGRRPRRDNGMACELWKQHRGKNVVDALFLGSSGLLILNLKSAGRA